MGVSGMTLGTIHSALLFDNATRRRYTARLMSSPMTLRPSPTRPMTMRELPRFVTLSRLADAKETLSGWVPAAKMARLRSAVTRAERPVRARILFFRDDTTAIHLRGECDTEVEMQCQRCLSAMPVALRSEVSVVVVRDEAALRRLRAEAEPLLHAGDRLNLFAFVEDEMLLSLPPAPMHPPEYCAAGRLSAAYATAGAQAADDAAARRAGRPRGERRGQQQPFADLKELLDTEKQNTRNNLERR